MEWFLEFATEHAAYAHWFLFFALVLAGLNLPISEEVVLVVGGVMASTVSPLGAIKLFLFVFAGAYLSDWMVYWIGRLLGPKLWNFRWFAKTVKRSRFEKVERYYDKYGIATLIVGRFIPFGFRNCLFMTAGMAKMHFPKFIIGDGIACFLSNSVIFGLAYMGRKNYENLLSYIEVFDVAIFATVVLAIIGIVWYKKARKAESG